MTTNRTPTPKRFTTPTKATNNILAKKLKIILGPTAVGKSDYAIAEAKRLDTVVVSCDSRQIFKELNIGVASPTPAQLGEVKHYFVASHSVTDYYTAGRYELEALDLLDSLFKTHDTVVMAGGSGLYIDALCSGLDDFPAAGEAIRRELMERLDQEGLETLARELEAIDPESYAAVDTANWRRVVRALEVTIATGRKFSSYKSRPSRQRPFEIEKVGLFRSRDELYDRINRRVDLMMEEGLEREAREVLLFRDLPALKTVGYKELFGQFDGLYDLQEAVRFIKRNTRHYAKRQMTWWRRDNTINWINLSGSGSVSEF